MTAKQEFLRRGLLTKIHKHEGCKQRKELEVWEDYLFASYGVRSCSAMSIDELYNLLDVLGDKAEPRAGGVRPRMKKKGKPEPLTEKQEAYIKRLWNLQSDKRGMTPMTKALSDFCFRTLEFRTIYINSLTLEQANKLITGSEYLFEIKKHKTKKEG
jgi:hypothetical protein